jgi:hypothetical protein
MRARAASVVGDGSGRAQPGHVAGPPHWRAWRLAYRIAAGLLFTYIFGAAAWQKTIAESPAAALRSVLGPLHLPAIAESALGVGVAATEATLALLWATARHPAHVRALALVTISLLLIYAAGTGLAGVATCSCVPGLSTLPVLGSMTPLVRNLVLVVFCVPAVAQTGAMRSV